MHFLITGHTGFKGAWLSMLLLERGHNVSGISLEPESNSLFKRTNITKLLENDIRCDIRESERISTHLKSLNPNVVIHLAAQALVRKSYQDPTGTFDTNVMGTLNLIKASQKIQNLKAQLIITTDKVYRNVNKVSGYVETDPLGGLDPYSASKAMADIATQSWLASFDNPPTAIVRAGNVIGGGDVCSDRLLPDLVHSYSSGLTPKLRSPYSIRPWHHVLDCLNGYLLLVNQLMDGNAEGAWNFGPEEEQVKSVSEVANLAGSLWGVERCWQNDLGIHPYEASLLMLNSNKAKMRLGWRNKLSFEDTVGWTINWYKNVLNGSDPYEESCKNIVAFEKL
jgi:CDP-glucose 4,6-dehydratase